MYIKFRSAIKPLFHTYWAKSQQQETRPSGSRLRTGQVENRIFLYLKLENRESKSKSFWTVENIFEGGTNERSPLLLQCRSASDALISLSVSVPGWRVGLVVVLAPLPDNEESLGDGSALALVVSLYPQVSFVAEPSFKPLLLLYLRNLATGQY